MRTRYRITSGVPLLLILLAGLLLRSLYLTDPFADAHSWRQIENAAIARGFATGPLDLLRPQVNWGGVGDASVAMEFPLLPATIALLYRVFGETEIAARAVVIAFSLGLVAVVYQIGKDLSGVAVGRGAALLMATSPSAVYFGRVPIVDTVMVFFSAAAVLFFIRYHRCRRPLNAVYGGISLGLAALVKLPAVLVLGPLVWAAWCAGGWRALSDKWFLGAVSLALLLAVGWYWHANELYLETGLTLGIWRGAGAYPEPLASLAGPTSTFTGWARADRLLDVEFYERMLGRVWTLHLTPVGFGLCLVGITMTVVRGIDSVLVWLLATAAFIVVAAEGNWLHEYYQLPLLPPAAILAGRAVHPLFDGPWVRRHVAGGWRGVTAVGCVVTLSCAVSFHYSGIVMEYFRPGWRDLTLLHAGAAIDQHTEPYSGLMVIEHAHIANAANSPILLYHARRRGWSFDLDSISVPAIEYVRRIGASYLATTLWPRLVAERPEIAEFLQQNAARVPVRDAPPQFRLFRLY